mgnify:FL=1
MSDTVKTLETAAKRLWDYFFAPKVRETQKTMLRYYRARVTTAASGGVMGVKRPFDDTEQFLPYVSSMAGAPLGAQVIVVMFGEGRNAKNHMVFMYPDGRNL